MLYEKSHVQVFPIFHLGRSFEIDPKLICIYLLGFPNITPRIKQKINQTQILIAH